MDTNKRKKKQVILFDILSLAFGLTGTCLGILSILALKIYSWHAGSGNPFHDDGSWNSFIITVVCLTIDSFSALFAFLSFIIGKQQYKLINFANLDPVGLNLAHHEKNSFILDEISFVISITGLCFGIISLVTIPPIVSHSTADRIGVSIPVTIVAVVLDFVSAMFIVAALEQYKEGQNVKSIVKMVKESVGISSPDMSLPRHNSK